MSWARTLLVGLFAENLRAKGMALLLSIVVFVFVQANIEGIETIRDLKLVFELAPELEGSHVLIDRVYILPKVEIRGEKGVLDSLRRELERATNIVQLTIDQPFLQGLGSPPYRLDRQFLKKHKIPAENVEVTEEVPDAPELLLRNKVPVQGLRLLAAQGMNLALGPDNPYEAPDTETNRLRPRFSPVAVRISGPEGAFRKALADYSTLFVAWEDDLDKWVRTRTPDKETFSYTNRLTIRWEESGFDPALAGLLEIDGRPAEEFRPAFAFDVKRRGEDVEVAIDLVVRDLPNPKERIDLVNGYRISQSYGFLGTIDDKSLATNKCGKILVRMPKDMAAEKERIAEKLVLVLDVGRAERGAGDVLDVRLFLDVKDRVSRPLLDSIRILPPPDKPDEKPHILFKATR